MRKIYRNHQLRNVMRISLFTVFSVCCCLLVFGSVEMGYAQLITIKAESRTVKEILTQIEKQAGTRFSYADKTVTDLPLITIDVKAVTLKEALDEVAKKVPLEFKQMGKAIGVNRKTVDPKPLSNPPKEPQLTEIPQERIRARITDSMGTPLIGVTVRINGTSQVTTTNGDGYFEFASVKPNASVVFSFIGFEQLTLPADRMGSSIILRLAHAELTEVEVNAGYWKVNDKLRTGNISKVSGETIRQQPVIDPMLGLAGRVPGVQISQVSGLPGSAHDIRIRGNNSIANGNDPLILIDGIPFTSQTLTNVTIGGGATSLSPFTLLNAQEIESVEVLKDADATAIYGSRGANGVLLITTKKGISGKTQFSLNAYSGLGKVTHKVDLLNTDQYLEMRREAFANDGITNFPANAYDVNGTWPTDRYTDWQNVVFGNTAKSSNVNAQIAGGTDFTQFTFGGGIQTETTVFPGEFKSRNHFSNISLNHQSKDKKFRTSLSVRYANNLNNQPTVDLSTIGTRLAPNAPNIYDDNGNLNWENNTWDNPFAQLNANASAITKNLIANSSFHYKLHSTLQLKLNTGYSEQTMDQSIITPLTYYSPTLSNLSQLRTHDFASNKLNNWIVEPQVDFNRELSSGILTITVGGTLLEKTNKILAQQASDFANDALINNILAASQVHIFDNSYTKYRYLAVFARANYNWHDRYLVNLVARRDGSSRFAPESRFGNFASISGAWIFSNERLFKQGILSFGKLRTSYGLTGNDQLADYRYLSTYSSYSFPYMGLSGLYPTRLYSPDYGWEAVRKVEFALDLGFFNDKLRLNSVFYRNRTDNQLVGYPLPTMTGFPSITANLNAIIENRGWEIEVNTTNFNNANFSWNTSFNVSIPENKLISYPDLDISTYRTRYETGKPLSINRRWHWTGVDPQTGIHTFQDVNNDGIISSPNDLRSLVNTAQQYHGGLSNTFSFKGLTLDIFFQFVKKMGRVTTGVPGSFINQPTWVLDRWQKPGDVTDVQRFTQSGVARSTMLNGLNNSDMVYEDASFARLKNLTLSYKLNPKLIRKLRLSNCTVIFQSQNLLTSTTFKGLDPETESFGVPPVKMTTVGLNLAF